MGRIGVEWGEGGVNAVSVFSSDPPKKKPKNNATLQLANRSLPHHSHGSTASKTSVTNKRIFEEREKKKK